jgi:hypothetical protein
VFEKDPAQFLAFRVTSDSGALTWTVANKTLLLAPVGGTAAPLTLDLTLFTIAALAQFLGFQRGYKVPYKDTSSLSQLSALVLIDGSGNVALSNGDHLYGYTSLLWAYINAASSELGLAQTQIANMLLQMSTKTASNEYLDLLGSYYASPRATGETDAIYAPAIIASVLLPSSNNVGMQLALQYRFPGTTAVVVDAYLDSAALLIRDGSIFFDAKYVHNSLSQGNTNGLFDVLFTFNFAGPISPAQYLPLLIAAVNGYRAAGTYLRQVSLRNIGATKISQSYYVGSILVTVFD